MRGGAARLDSALFQRIIALEKQSSLSRVWFDLLVGGDAMQYTFFVDESGQSGIKVVGSEEKKGASRYMTMGGVLVPEPNKENLLLQLGSLRKSFGKKDLHCSRLNHNQICRFAKVVASERVRLFGVISLKETLGSYREDIEANDKKYYNKCAQYLLERLAHFMESADIDGDQLSIVFEEGGYDYSALRGLIAKCRSNPLNPATRRLQRVNPDSIISRPKAEEPLLQASDLVAHALFRCVDDGPSTHGIRETRYLNELSSKFFSDSKSKAIVSYGIFPVHKLSDIKAEREVESFLANLKAE